MFPTAFCDAAIERYSKKGATVFDPFAGRGTALYSAATSGRRALGIELNPVGWIYSRTKLTPADEEDVTSRIKQIQARSYRYSHRASQLPTFFDHCFCSEVRAFLLSARHSLNWRQNSIDRTVMALLLVHLHGKASDSLSNQMRQTKALAPNYAVRWWKARGYKPPKIDPVEFFRKKVTWRYAKGTPQTTPSKVYLGDSTEILPQLRGHLGSRHLNRPSLMLTSPPYFGITNYHYDQWLRLWLLGGPPGARRANTKFNGKHRRKFENRSVYSRLLTTVFQHSAQLMKPDAIAYVRTDRREPTLSITKQALTLAFPKHTFHRVNRPIKGLTQTRLFGNGDPRHGEVDLVLTP
jgi:hypothetical protein